MAQKFRLLPDVAIADVAFEAFGKNEEELFENAAFAVEEIMVDTKEVKQKVTKEVEVEAKDLETLLFDWLQELVYLKDAELLVFSSFDVKITKSTGGFNLAGAVRGEKLDMKRHEFRADVKAVTWHMFELKKEKEGWRCRVVLDI